MEDDIIQKKFYGMIAHDLDKNDNKISSFIIKTNNKFTDNLFSAIRNGDYSFVSKSMKYKFHLGQTYKGKTPIEVCIDSDQSRIFKLLLNDLHDRDDFLKSNGYALLFHAAAVDARKCLEQLNIYGVPMNYIDRGNNGVTPLNIAIKNQSHDVATYLCNNVNDYSPALQFASKSGEQDLNDLSLFLYKHSNSNIAVISKAYPSFKYENYGSMYITSDPDDAAIYVDNDLKGKGNVKIEELELGKTYAVEIKKFGLQSSKRNVTPVKGKITEVKAVLQKPPITRLSLKTHNSQGYRLKTYID